jgi:hypothetical protein
MDKCTDAQIQRHNNIGRYVLRRSPDVSVRLGFLTLRFGRGAARHCSEGDARGGFGIWWR